MTHLSLEQLARLLDEEPTPTEMRHLEGCASCRTDLEALRADPAGLAQLPDLVPPPPELWEGLQVQLRAEGLIRERTRWWTLEAPRSLRAAAAIVLFLAGGVVGYGIHGLGFGDEGGSDELIAEYRTTLQHYAALLSDSIALDPVERLEILDELVRTTSAALDLAPADPLINGYHHLALTERDAALQRLAVLEGDHWY